MSSPVTVWRHHKSIKNYLGKKGKIIVWTKVFVAPAGFEHEAPYPVVIAEFTDGKRIPLQLVEYEEKHLKPNQKIITVVRRLGKVKLDRVIEYGIKAKPV
ncbi:hypothetical protein KKE78_04585 [Patescibacteria group bacterium]|nr:hypothetical protein [Patescibacteria group bacterium]